MFKIYWYLIWPICWIKLFNGLWNTVPYLQRFFYIIVIVCIFIGETREVHDPIYFRIINTFTLPYAMFLKYHTNIIYWIYKNQINACSIFIHQIRHAILLYITNGSHKNIVTSMYLTLSLWTGSGDCEENS